MTKKKQKKKNKVLAFTIADEKNLEYYKMLKNSFRHFHPDIDLRLVGGKELDDLLKKDPYFFYRATPAVALNFIDDYNAVIKIDADSIITGDLSHTWTGEFDVGVVNNSNPRELKKYPVTVWNIHPLSYVNCGFVVMKSRRFIEHWLTLCASPHFQHYQMREQDLLNIMVFYMNKGLGGPYEVNFLDASPYAHGLVAKGYWIDMEKPDDRLVLPKNDEWNTEDKVVKVLHAAGGNQDNKWNLNTQFKSEVSKWLKEITS